MLIQTLNMFEDIWSNILWYHWFFKITFICMKSKYKYIITCLEKLIKNWIYFFKNINTYKLILMYNIFIKHMYLKSILMVYPNLNER